MKKLMITAAALMVACAAYGQGQFFFNTHDTTAGNVVQFSYNGALVDATVANAFVQVSAGADATHLTALTPLMPLNNTGAKAGYINPLSQTFTVAGMAGGSSATVGYQAFLGTSLASASAVSGLTLSTTPVTLTEPPTPPNEVALGTHTVVITPEPATLALGLLGLGTILAFRRRS
jgi:MYXO-CTERM domain-containing protein